MNPASSKAPHAAGYTSLESETQFDDLPVEGDMPAWLEGALFRLGPGKFDVNGRTLDHHFDGFGMLHRFGFANGKVGYRNKFIDSPALRHSQRTGEIAYPTFATPASVAPDPKEERLNVNANVNIYPIGEDFFAWTDGSTLPVAFDPNTLVQTGVTHWDDDLSTANALGAPGTDAGRNTTAHWHCDVHGTSFNYFTDYQSGAPHYNFFKIETGSRRRIPLASVKTDAASYVHAFNITERYIVFPENPCRIDAAKLRGGTPFGRSLHWREDVGTRIHIIDKNDGSLVRTVETNPSFIMHTVNAFERGTEIVLDIAAYANSNHLLELHLNPADRPAGGRLADEWTSELRSHAKLTRIVIDVATGRFSETTISDTGIELPTINFATENGRPYQRTFAASLHDESSVFYDQIARIDVESGAEVTWHVPGHFPGEAVLVTEPSGGNDAVVLSVVLDTGRRVSYLACLDARTLETRAKVSLPHIIPFNFHGFFVPDQRVCV